MVGAFLYLILGGGKILEIFTKLFKSGDKPKNVTAGSVCNFFFGEEPIKAVSRGAVVLWRPQRSVLFVVDLPVSYYCIFVCVKC